MPVEPRSAVIGLQVMAAPACGWPASAAPQCPWASAWPSQALAFEKNGSVELITFRTGLPASKAFIGAVMKSFVSQLRANIMRAENSACGRR
jgi:hypothetical protein